MHLLGQMSRELFIKQCHCIVTLKKTYIHPHGNWVIVFQWSHRGIFHHGIISNRITESQCLNHRCVIENSGHLRCTMRKKEQPYAHCYTSPQRRHGGEILECKPCGELVRWSNTFWSKGRSSITKHTYAGINESLIFLIEIIDWILINRRIEPNSPSSLNKPTTWSRLNNSFFCFLDRCCVWIPIPPRIILYGSVMLSATI